MPRISVDSRFGIIKDAKLAMIDNEKMKSVSDSLKAIKNSENQFRTECHNKGIRPEEFNLNYTV
jgi:hypothetical protein